MFLISNIETNPITNEPAIWFYSPRCNLNCNPCKLPFKTDTDYNKLDVVIETEKVRNKISSAVFYLGGMKQKPHVIIKYLNVLRSKWNGLERYIAFTVPNIVYLWKYFNDDLLHGFIYYLKYPLWGKSNKTIYRYIDKTGCSERDYLQSLTLIKILENTNNPPNYCIKIDYNINKLRIKKEKEWTKKLINNLNCI